MRFDPPRVTIKPGGAVTWKQVGEMPHAIITNDQSFSSPLLAGNSEFSHTFEKPGSYFYHCIIHPSMQGEIRVME
jgi:plastocyanin